MASLPPDSDLPGEADARNPVIPHILHRIWLGRDPMPEEFRRFGETWKHHHPNWEMRLWTDANVPALSCQEAFERSRNPAERSDVLRYELLRQFGGVYVDTDVECLRPIDELLDGLRVFAVSASRGRDVGNVILGTVPNHPAFAQAVEHVKRTAGIGTFPKATGGALRVLADFPDATILPKLPAGYVVHHRARSGREPYDLAAELRLVQGQLALAKRVIRRREARLEQIENSAWWRLGLRLSPLLRVAARLRRVRGE